MNDPQQVVGLRMMFVGGGFITRWMHARQANDILTKWIKGEYKARTNRLIGDTTNPVDGFGLDTDHLMFVDIIPYNPQQQQITPAAQPMFQSGR